MEGEGSAVGAVLGGRSVGGRRRETDGHAGAGGLRQRGEAPSASQAGSGGREAAGTQWGDSGICVRGWPGVWA